MKWISLDMLLALSLLGCSSSDSQSVGGNYYLSNGDASHVYIWKKSKSENTIVVDQQIVDLKIENAYVLVLRKVAESFDCYDEKNQPKIVTHYSNKDEYWIIDPRKENEIGPLKEQAYSETLKKLGLPLVQLSAPSNFVPNTGAFKESTKDCKKLVW